MPSSNKSIARNTLLLYGRKIFTLSVALYTSRLLLERLGVTDFGIYGLVGSVVALFSALRGIFSSSIQRFINIAKGSESSEQVNVIFSIGLKIHIGIAIVFLMIGEIGGTIMVHYLKIPPESVMSANLVLQFSLFTAVATILTVPYDALIIANEKFDAYAIFSIIDFSLRLVVVILLKYFQTNRLAVYSALLFVTALIVRYINLVYCRKKFGPEAKYRAVKNTKLLKQMTSFAGWQFLGNTAYTVTNNGINFVLNLMGGVVVNAARTLAYQVMSAISQFIGDLNLSFQPRTMMLYAQGNIHEFLRLIYLNTKANFAIAVILAFPIFILAEPLLKVWLGEVPPYSVSFVKAIMIYLVVRSIHAPIDLYFKSYGNIKKYQLIELIILSLNLPLSWIALHFRFPFYSVFIIMAAVEGINITALLILANRQYGFKITTYIKQVIIRLTLITTILSILAYIYDRYVYIEEKSLIDIILIASFCLCSVCVLLFLFLFSKQETMSMIQIIRKKRYEDTNIST